MKNPYSNLEKFNLMKNLVNICLSCSMEQVAKVVYEKLILLFANIDAILRKFQFIWYRHIDAIKL